MERAKYMFFGRDKKPTAPSNENDGLIPAARTGGSMQDLIFDVGAEDFEAKVIMASMERPVIVEFWAPWCGPCKQLMPILEQAVQAAGGKVAMAKVNMDENQEMAAAMRIQSVPTVYAFFQGRPVDGFQGAMPASQVQAFIQKILEAVRQAQPDAMDIPEALKQASELMAAGDLMAAQSIYTAILSQDENNVDAYTGMVRLLIAAEQIDKAKGLVSSAPEPIAKDPKFSEARAALEMAELTPATPVAELQAAIEKDPADHQARYDLSLALFAKGQQEEAMDQLLEIIGKKPDWNEQAARKQLLKFFEALGQTHPLTVSGRRRLSSLLFS